MSVMQIHETEEGLQAAVLELAAYHGWLVAHFRPARVGRGEAERWITPVQADGKGFPDLVLVRERVLFRELKRERGRLTLEQRLWADRLTRAGADYDVWRPSSWPKIVETLTAPRPA